MMDFVKFYARILVLVLVIVTTSAAGDLNSDKQSLLAFASQVHHGSKLNWTSITPVCTWVGITCNSNKTRVIDVRLPGTGLRGSIPSDTLGKLDALQVLSLRSNRLAIKLPPDVSSLPSLRSLYLQHNNLSGNLPASFSSEVTSLDLSYNSFSGIIPDAFDNFTELTTLYLQNNLLSGKIPELNLPKLKNLNLSFNNLSGQIPKSLQSFTKDSFLGNPFLCGSPFAECITIPPSPSPLPTHKKSFWKRLSLGVIIGIAAGGLVILLLSAICLFLCILKRKTSTQSSTEPKGKATVEKQTGESSSGIQVGEKNKLVFFEGCAFNFDLEDLLRASAEVLGKGSYGTTYKAVLEDGTTVVVKRLREVVVGKKEFEQQMEIVGRVGQHPNVLPLRAYYYSKDEKLLVHDYVPGGNFSSLLHGSRGSGRTPLDWDTRIRIALSAARGIAHIHSQGGPKFTHGNIKSNNILTNSSSATVISDFGLATMLTSSATPSCSVIGYRAPESLESKKYTHKSDVYSFGVVLLEILTGKAPIQSPGRDDVADLPRWVQSVVREEWTAEVFDLELMREKEIEEEMVQMLQIAMGCVVKSPEQRPGIEDVVRMMEEIRPSDSENRTSEERV